MTTHYSRKQCGENECPEDRCFPVDRFWGDWKDKYEMDRGLTASHDLTESLRVLPRPKGGPCAVAGGRHTGCACYLPPLPEPAAIPPGNR